MTTPTDRPGLDLKRALGMLESHAARLKAQGLTLVDREAVLARLAKVKLTKVALPDRAAAMARLHAARSELGERAKRVREQLPRSLNEVGPRAREFAERIAEAVPRRPPQPLPTSIPAPEIAAPIPRPTATADNAEGAARRPTIDQAARSLAPPVLVRLTPLLLSLVAAGLIHIATTFAVPMLLGSASAWQRLRPVLPNANRMVLLPPPAPGAQILPFLSPDMRYAMCRYDLTDGPVAVTAALPELGWSLTLHSPQGDNFYAVPGQELRATDLAFQLVQASDRLIDLAPGVRRSDVDISRVTSPTREGLIIVRSPIKGVAHRAEIERVLAKAGCMVLKR